MTEYSKISHFAKALKDISGNTLASLETKFNVQNVEQAGNPGGISTPGTGKEPQQPAQIPG